jgi:type I restriction enzyme S subunit
MNFTKQAKTGNLVSDGYKDTPVGRIPKDWDVGAIGNINNFSLCTGGTPSTNIDEYWRDEIPWMVSGDVHKKIIYNVSGRISKKGYENSNATWIPKKSILIALAGQGKTRGTVAINEIELTTNQSVAAILIKNTNTDPYFIFYYIDSQYENLRQMSSGEGRAGLNLTILKEIIVPLPPLHEQHKIATIISTVEALITDTDVIISKIDQVKFGLLQDLFTKGIGHTDFKETIIGQVPKNWHIVSLNELLSEKTKYGYSGSETPDGSPIKMLTLSAVTNNDISIKNTKICNFKTNLINGYWVEKDDIFIGRSNTRKLVGLVAIYKKNEPFAIFSDLLVRIRVNEKRILPQYMYYYALSPYARSYFSKSAKGTSGSMKKIDTTTIEQLKIPLSPLDEQLKIVTILSVFDERLIQEHNYRAYLKHLKKGLMHDLLTGKVRVKTDSEVAAHA